MRHIGLWLVMGGMLFPLELDALEEAVLEVGFRTEGDQVHVFYTLVGQGEYEVSLRLSDDGGRSFARRPRTLSGDVGRSVEPGRNKRIIWDVLMDVRSLEGDAFVFQVRARRPGKGFEKKWLLGLAGAAVGAAAYALLGEAPASIIVEVPDPEE